MIHQHYVGSMPCERVNGIQARADDSDDFMPTRLDERSQRRPHVFLVLSNQDAHQPALQKFMTGPTDWQRMDLGSGQHV